MTASALLQSKKAASTAALFSIRRDYYSVDSISKPQASSNGSGMYLEFLLRRAHSRKRVERRYWSGVSLNSFTSCSNDVTTGITGPIGSGLPQFELPLLLAMLDSSCLFRNMNIAYQKMAPRFWIPERCRWFR